MKKTTTMKIQVGRFGYPVLTVEMPISSTFEDVMNKVTSENGWESLTSAEKAFVNNVPLDMEDELENGDNIQIIARKEGGLK